MQPVLVTEDDAEFSLAWERLVSAGIHVTERPSYAAMVKYVPGVRGRAIHVVVHQQFEDAIALLRDSSHTVAVRIDPQELARFQREAGEQAAEVSSRFMSRILGVAAGLAVALLTALFVYVLSAQ